MLIGSELIQAPRETQGRETTWLLPFSVFASFSLDRHSRFAIWKPEVTGAFVYITVDDSVEVVSRRALPPNVSHVVYPI